MKQAIDKQSTTGIADMFHELDNIYDNALKSVDANMALSPELATDTKEQAFKVCMKYRPMLGAQMLTAVYDAYMASLSVRLTVLRENIDNVINQAEKECRAKKSNTQNILTFKGGGGKYENDS